MKITLNQIKEHSPGSTTWITLLLSQNKTHADDDPIHLMDILESNGLDDAIWCLRCCDYNYYCLFLAEIAESVLPYFEKHNSSRAPREAIAAIRRYQHNVVGAVSNVDIVEAMASVAIAVDFASAADASYDFTNGFKRLFIKHFKKNTSCK